MRTTITQGAFAHSINGRIVSAGTWTSVARTTVPRPPSQVAQLTSRGTTMNRLGWAARGGGSILAGISGGIEQWRTDAGRTDLTTTDRVGRAAGVGTYMAGAAMAGAMIGSVIPVGGTLAGRRGRRGRRPRGGRCREQHRAREGVRRQRGPGDRERRRGRLRRRREGIETGLREAGEFIEGTGERISEGVSELADHVPDIDVDIDWAARSAPWAPTSAPPATRTP